ATPSPQTVSRHASPGASHTQPLSVWQFDEQPSLSSSLPSSQVSRPRRTPSPQVARQAEPALGQVHPTSTSQAASQPSLSSLLPSSQVSAPWSNPSETQASPGEGHA